MGARELAHTLALNTTAGFAVFVTIIYVLVCVIAISNWLVSTFRSYWKKAYKSEMERDFEKERECYPLKRSAREKIMKIADPLTHFKDAGRNGNDTPKLTDLLFTKVNEPRESHDRDPEIGRENILEFKCIICSKDLIDDSNNKDSGWITVMPDCLHMCHAECVPQRIKFLYSSCPNCGRRVEKKHLKEVLITVNPLAPKA